MEVDTWRKICGAGSTRSHIETRLSISCLGCLKPIGSFISNRRYPYRPPFSRVLHLDTATRCTRAWRSVWEKLAYSWAPLVQSLANIANEPAEPKVLHLQSHPIARMFPEGSYCGHSTQCRHVYSSVAEKSPISDFREVFGGIVRFPS